MPKAEGDNGTGEQNVYNEYMWVNGKWEFIGDTAVSLAGYATEDYVEGAISDAKAAQALIDAAQDALIASNSTKIAELREDVGTDDGKGALFGRVASLEAFAAANSNSELEGRVTTLEGKVTTLEGEMDAVQAILTGYSSTSTVKASQDAQDALIASNSAKIASNSGRLDALEALPLVQYEVIDEDLDA